MPTSRRGGGVTKRCECRGEDGKRLGAKCPKLRGRRHGAFEIHQELPEDAESKRRRFRRTGYADKDAAEGDLERVRDILKLAKESDERRRVGDLLAGLMRSREDIPDLAEVRRKLKLGGALDESMTMGDLLDDWLALKQRTRRRTTSSGYETHVRLHIKPRIGHYRTDRLGVPHAQAMFDDIAEQNEVVAAENEARREQVERSRWRRAGRPPAHERQQLAAERAKLDAMPPFRKLTNVPTQHAVRRTLHAVLEYGIGRQVETGMQLNVAKYVELSPYRRPRGLLWTDERVACWRATGEIPGPVMVWSPAQLGAFLDAAESSRLYAGFHLIAHHGLRRGECAGQPWADIVFARKRVRVSRSRTVDGWEPYEDDPKTEDSAAEVAIDSGTVAVLQAHQLSQLAERDAWNAQAKERRAQGDDVADWTDSGKVLVREDGTPIHPQELSDEFEEIVEREGLPPINLRDLRHGAAALVKAGGGDIHDAKVKLRHSTITLTSDTYMELFQEWEDELTERAAAVVPRARKAANGADVA
jgi:hypothetical protein